MLDQVMPLQRHVFSDLGDFERGVIDCAPEMKHSISQVFGYSRTTISRVYHGYKASWKTSPIPVGVGKSSWKNGTVDNWRESSNEIDVQHFLKLLRLSINKCQRANCPTVRGWYDFQTCKHIRVSLWPAWRKNCTPRLGYATPPLNCWWMEIHCLAWLV